MSGLMGFLVYNAPWMLAVYRRRTGQPILGSLPLIIFANLLLGWTVVMWFLCLMMALNINVVAPVAIYLAKILAGSGLAGNTGASGASAPAGSGMCYACHGSGTVTKTNLELSAMDAQNTMNQQNQLTRQVPCSACNGTGRI